MGTSKPRELEVYVCTFHLQYHSCLMLRNFTHIDMYSADEQVSVFVATMILATAFMLH